MFSAAYEFVLCLDTMHHKNNILLLAICISNGCVLLYAVMQYRSMDDTTHTVQNNRDFNSQPLVDISRDLWKEIQPAELTVPIIIGLSTIIIWPVAYWLHKEYSWAIYQCVQGNPRSRFQYLGYEVVHSFHKVILEPITD